MDVDYDRLKGLVTYLTSPPKQRPTEAILVGLASLHIARHLSLVEAGDQSSRIEVANSSISDIFGLGGEGTDRKSLKDVANDIHTKQLTNVSYMIPFSLLFHEHALANPAPRGGLDVTRDRAAASRVRVSKAQGPALVRATCLLLCRHIRAKSDFSWSVSSEPTGLWRYGTFGDSLWDTSVTGTVMVGLASAQNMGVFELPEPAYCIQISSNETLNKSMFFGAVFDAALLTLKVFVRDNPPSPPFEKELIKVDDFQTLVRRGRDRRRQIRIEQIGSGRAKLTDLLVYGYQDPAGPTNVYLTASGGYSVLTAANLIETILGTVEQNGSMPQKKVGIAFPFVLAGTAADGSRIWKGAGPSNAGDEIVLRRDGYYTGVQAILGGRRLDPDRAVHRAINAVATMLHGAFNYKGGISGLDMVDREATLKKLSTHAPAAGLFGIMKFLLAAGYSDAVGPVAWPLDFAKLTDHIKVGTGKYYEAEHYNQIFAALVLTRAYRPLFQSFNPNG